MAKSAARIRARKMRHTGESIKTIASKLAISSGTVSLWCRDITLTPQQIRRLEQSRTRAGAVGRMKGAQMQKERRLQRIREFQVSGRDDVRTLTHRERFLTGLGLYAGEGFKYGNRAGFSNSDPRIIKFMVNWFKDVCKVPMRNFSCQIGLNTIHRARDVSIKKYWTEITGIPVTQFTKTSFKKTKINKIYENPERHFGTLALRIRKSSTLEYKILGWLDALLLK